MLERQDHVQTKDGQAFRFGTRTIKVDAAGRYLLTQQVKVKLTRTQYRLCQAFLTELKQRSLTVLEYGDGLTIVAYLSRRQLQSGCHVANQKLLRKHIVNTNNRLDVLGMQIVPLSSWGFLLVIRPLSDP